MPVSAFKLTAHLAISDAAYARSSVFQLMKDIDIDGARPLVLSGRSHLPVEWLRKGAQDEDDFVSANLLRFRNHFYDPYRNRGLAWGVELGEAAPDWALEDTEYWTQQYSYRDAREAFFNALTFAGKDGREAELARTCEILGHVIHLIQDMAVPAHTRNDIHNVPPVRPDSLYEELLEGAVLNVSGNPVPYRPSRALWTSGDYQWGSGLADFTNRNFISDGTNFIARVNGATAKDYPLPRLWLSTERTEPVTVTDREGNQVQGVVSYFSNDMSHPITGSMLHNAYMTTYSFFDRELKRVNKSPLFTLNRQNISRQADILVPLAVSYSAGLLDQFFRPGSLEFRVDLDEEDPGHLQLSVQNTTSEEMSGVFTLYADNSEDRRSSLVGWSGSLTSSGYRTTIPMETLPEKAKRLILVFRGRHGDDSDVVRGRARPWEMPVILAKQELAVFTGEVEEVEYMGEFPLSSWKKRFKRSGKQRIQGTFVTPSDEPGGKYVKKVWLTGSALVNAPVRLYDQAGNRISSDPASDPSAAAEWVPTRWEIEIDQETIYYLNSYGQPEAALLPRFLIVETVAGMQIKNPLVWWARAETTSSASLGEGGKNCGFPGYPDIYCVGSTTVDTATSGRLLFGDGNAVGDDVHPATGEHYPVGSPHTAVHFTPVSAAGHGPVFQVVPLEGCTPEDLCSETSASCHGGAQYVFQGEGPDGEALWVKESFFVTQSDVESVTRHASMCVMPAPTLRPLPDLPVVVVERDYFPAEENLLRRLGFAAPVKYKITLK
jgi:hypothetical protein